jgi:hypothetical protein
MEPAVDIRVFQITFHLQIVRSYKNTEHWITLAFTSILPKIRTLHKVEEVSKNLKNQLRILDNPKSTRID